MADPPERDGWAPIDPGEPTRPAAPPPAGTPAGPTPPLPGGWAPPSPTWSAPRPKGGGERTGPLPLHPMNLSDVIDGAFKLYKANFLTVILITLAITAPIHVLSSFLARDQLPEGGFFNVLSDPEAFEATAEAQDDASTEQVVAQALFAVISVLVTPFVAGAIARVVAASYLGETMSVGDALRTTMRRAPALFVAWLLVHLLEFSGLIVILVGVIVTLPLFMTLFVATAPALVVEELGPVAAMRRSWRLMRPRFWPVLGISLIAGFMAQVVGGVVGGVPSFIGVIVGRDFGWIFLSLGAVLGAIASQPIVAIVATLLYFDGRIRHEAFDLQVIARDLDDAAPRR